MLLSPRTLFAALAFSLAVPAIAQTPQKNGDGAWTEARCHRATTNFSRMTGNRKHQGVPDLHSETVTVSALQETANGLESCAIRYQQSGRSRDTAKVQREIETLHTLLSTKEVRFLGTASLVSQYNAEYPNGDLLLPSSDTYVTEFLRTHSLMERFTTEDTRAVETSPQPQTVQRLLLADAVAK